MKYYIIVHVDAVHGTETESRYTNIITGFVETFYYHRIYFFCPYRTKRNELPEIPENFHCGQKPKVVLSSRADTYARDCG